jgi:hypothetical protein
VSNGSGSSGCADADPLAAQRHGDREQGLSSQNISETTTVRDQTMNYLVTLCHNLTLAARRCGPAHALWFCAHGRGASACDARLVRAARGVH